MKCRYWWQKICSDYLNLSYCSDYIQESPDNILLEEVSVDDFYEGFSSINELHVKSVDVSKPVILAEIAPGRYNLIDGKPMKPTLNIGIVNGKSNNKWIATIGKLYEVPTIYIKVHFQIKPSLKESTSRSDHRIIEWSI